ncbi:uncharacterized protein BXZ73DRAFT_80783 [Epithele typhae]|uniref:uncharacterized protein n=1 Tax=Epithele typhae TaxID=378194 RepID=UPI002007CFA3|nr:uncharacterized protein BXZ73DRAFT_80783 [Epithele typhae]KAH9917660.1 hypothetical protein BXZ73DRAFT_80783 [Epithele typhae]
MFSAGAAEELVDLDHLYLDSDDSDSEFETDAAALIESVRKPTQKAHALRLRPELRVGASACASLRQTSRTPKKTVPFASLLREKRRDEQAGTGADAVIREAERIVLEHKAGLLRENDDAVGDDSDGSDTDDPDYAIATASQWLGSGAKAVNALLADDSKARRARKAAKNRDSTGVPFWSQDAAVEDAMDLDPSGFNIHTFTTANDHPVLRYLQDVATRQDHTKMGAILSSSHLSSLKPCHLASVIPWLFEVSLSNAPFSLPDLALSQLAKLASTDGIPVLRNASITNALLRLGASPAALSTHGLPLNTITHGEKGGTCDPAERSDILLTVILLAMDPTTSNETLVEIRKAGQSLAKAMSATSEELTICQKLVLFGHTLSPENQALLLSSIPTASDPAFRIGRVVARALLLGITDINAEDLERLPPLKPLIELLSASAGSKGPFDVAGHANTPGFFDDLSCRVALLSRALIPDIHDYALQERRKGDASTGPLREITARLHALHGSIADGRRGAHSDRLRVKDVLLRLWVRVESERKAVVKLRQGKLGAGKATRGIALRCFHDGTWIQGDEGP